MKMNSASYIIVSIFLQNMNRVVLVFAARFPSYTSNTFLFFLYILANDRCIAGIYILRCKPLFYHIQYCVYEQYPI